MSTKDKLKPGDKSPYDRIKEVTIINTPRSENTLFPVVILIFEKLSSIVGDDAVCFTPEDAIAIGNQLVASGGEALRNG